MAEITRRRRSINGLKVLKKVFVVGGDHAVVAMFKDWHHKIVYEPNKADLIVFTGGADVSPMLYGEENTGDSYTDEPRDLREIGIYRQFLGTPMAGICRGGQFLNVMAGGRMLQHIEGHGMAVHPAWDNDGRVHMVHGDHHQGIIRKQGKSYSLLAANYAPNVHETVMCSPVGLTEACIYPAEKSLCFQPHPEWGHQPTEELFFNYLYTHLGEIQC